MFKWARVRACAPGRRRGGSEGLEVPMNSCIQDVITNNNKHAKVEVLHAFCYPLSAKAPDLAQSAFVSRSIGRAALHYEARCFWTVVEISEGLGFTQKLCASLSC